MCGIMAGLCIGVNRLTSQVTHCQMLVELMEDCVGYICFIYRAACSVLIDKFNI